MLDHHAPAGWKTQTAKRLWSSEPARVLVMLTGYLKEVLVDFIRVAY
jgi:hypothetical protein